MPRGRRAPAADKWEGFAGGFRFAGWPDRLSDQSEISVFRSGCSKQSPTLRPELLARTDFERDSEPGNHHRPVHPDRQATACGAIEAGDGLHAYSVRLDGGRSGTARK